METKVTKNYNFGGYEQVVKYLVESKTIYFIDCNCPNFTGIVEDKDGKPKLIGSKRMKSSGQCSDIRVFSESCKHLLPIVKVFEAQGLTLKRPKPMEGTDKCTKELRKILIERTQGLCECVCGRDGKEIHRIIQGKNGGKYNEKNCILLCKECHKNRHFHGQ